jgi:lipopolysaccharide transport system ATP-binding protein
MQTVIKVEGLGKLYRLGEVGTGTLSHDLKRWWYRVRGKEDPYLKIGQVNDRTQRAEKGELVWALRNINLEVQQGEVLGVIGKNGAGKSTLLKILSRITSPTEGIVKVKGRIASLLEVGTGFHPEMTGRENIYMNGTLMGMRRWEIDKKLDEIVEFAGVAKYIDTPVKRYSSGMTVRLGFAVAAHLNAEILLVDEVLAVGDAEFQKKALGKMHEVSHDQGRTVLFVSHNMGAVSKLCTRGILLRNGMLVHNGSVNEVVSQYISSSNTEQATYNVEGGAIVDKHIGYFTRLSIENIEGEPLQPVPVGIPWQLRIHFTLVEKVNYVLVAVSFKNAYDINVRTVFSNRMDLKPGSYEIIFREKEILFGEGQLKISLGLSSYEKPIHYVEDVASIVFTSANGTISDSRIIRTSNGVILNPMECFLSSVEANV